MTHTIQPAPEFKKNILEALVRIVGPEGFSTRLTDAITYCRDANYHDVIAAHYHVYQHLPSGVVWPESAQQISQIVKLAIKHKLRITPVGGGSGVCGGASPLEGNLVLDTKRMNRVINFDHENFFIEAEAGMMGLELEKFLNRQGFTLGHFPVSISNATLGGYLATKAAGQFSSKYGKIEDLVIDLEFVDGRGRIVQTKDVSRTGGADLTQFVLGSEGSLGIFTKARLKIFPKPDRTIFMAHSFGNMDYGTEAQRRIIQTGIRPDVLRLYDKLDTAIMFSRLSSTGIPVTDWPFDVPPHIKKILRRIKSGAIQLLFRYQRLVREMSELSWLGCVLIAMLEGDEPLIARKKHVIQKICSDLDAKNLGAPLARHWFEHRFSVAHKIPVVFRDGGFTDTMDVATTWDNLIPLYNAVLAKLAPLCLVLTHITHTYHDGASIYFTFVAPLKGLKNSLALHDEIWKVALDAVQKYGGVISHHNGIGRLKKHSLNKEWGSAGSLLQSLKNDFDPHHVLNPGVLFD